MDSLFFTISKVFWAFARPDHFLLLLLVLSLLLLRSGLPRPPRMSAYFGYRLLQIITLGLILTALYPVGNLFLEPLEKRFARQDSLQASEVAGVIILGGAEEAELSRRWGSIELNEAAERDLAMLYLLRRYPRAQFVFTGGAGDLLKQNYKGGDVAQALLQQFNASRRVVVERESRNTFENAVLIEDLVDRTRPGQWLLVTSGYHMPRAMGVFQKRGWPVVPYSVDHRSQPLLVDNWKFDLADNLDDFTTGVREWVGLLAYWLTDKTPALFPGPRRP